MKLSITEKARQEPKVSCSEHCRQQLPLPELVEQRGEIELLTQKLAREIYESETQMSEEGGWLS